MRPRYHPIEDGLWKDDKFDPDVTKGLPDASFIERAFFAYLASNDHQRPSGIYRVSDAELSAGSKLPLGEVQGHLHTLEQRGLIVRDGAWLFLPGYFGRQAKNPRLLSAVESQVNTCTSRKVLLEWGRKFPLYSNYLPDGFLTVVKQSDNGQQTWESNSPLRAVSEQSSIRAEKTLVGTTETALDPQLQAVLSECPHLALVSTPASARFWDQVLGACEPYGVSNLAWIGVRLRSWNQWFEANKSRRSRRREVLESRLMSWLTRDLEKQARRKA